ncbi:hypothetical protein [Aliicoccus persicus]|uniref:Uncharacterized protein n=1 Tax=Aliicoccus persicus TaxID=930138 RepID=A0A662Z4G4_9STAP|nr:hypothetical protein [Aliicoccus persicus]SEW10666.1 hypothetical protein SAMN05192557_1620 [Aliicoccus persicus]
MDGQKRVFPLVLAGVILVLLILQVLNDQWLENAQLLDVINILFIVMVISIFGYAVYMLWDKFKK